MALQIHESENLYRYAASHHISRTDADLLARVTISGVMSLPQVHRARDAHTLKRVFAEVEPATEEAIQPEHARRLAERLTIRATLSARRLDEYATYDNETRERLEAEERESFARYAWLYRHGMPDMETIGHLSDRVAKFILNRLGG